MSDHPRSHVLAACALFVCCAMTSVHAAELTIDRMFDSPALAGPTVTGLKISPDGTRVTFLQPKPGQKERMDLWEYNVADGVSRLLVDSEVLARYAQPLSDEEKSRRERLRIAGLTGILDYSFARSGQALLFPLDGNVFHFDLTKPPDAALTPIAVSKGFTGDAGISPRGGHVAYVRDQNLFVYSLATGIERALTSDGGGVIKNGLAEFVAQEEMDRSAGYWWAPDDRHIAFTRVDESPIPVTERFEIAADNVTTFAQRYPLAGGPNAEVRLGVVDVESGEVTGIDLGANKDMYLARVQWLPDGRTLAVQRESRDQHTLDLLFADVSSGHSHVVLTERSDSWIDLNDELTFLEKSHEFIWASSRDGYEHLYLYDHSGHLRRRLTAGTWNVDDFRTRAIKYVDERRRLVYFSATEHGPTTRHLYAASLDTKDPTQVRRISRENGVHRVSVAAGARFYVDNFTSTTHPPQVSLRSMDGALITFLQENRADETHPDAPYATENSIPEFGSLKADDGQMLLYKIYKPRGFDPARRYPAIVSVYGGPGVQRVLDQWTGDNFTQILTRSGYVVFQLDNRGSAFRGTGFQSPIHGHLGDVEVRDQVAGARWLASQPFVDAGRIGVWGWSYGGYMTLMLMFKAPDVFRAGVAGAPVTDWTLYDTHYTERYLGRPQDNAEGYAASSVLPYAKDLKGALLVMHGMADDNVLLLHSTKLFRALQDLGKPFDVMMYPGAKHGLMAQHDGRHGYAMVLRFFEEKLR
jgi:dipeptidyl-peptidase-4